MKTFLLVLIISPFVMADDNENLKKAAATGIGVGAASFLLADIGEDMHRDAVTSKGIAQTNLDQLAISYRENALGVSPAKPLHTAFHERLGEFAEYHSKVQAVRVLDKTLADKLRASDEAIANYKLLHSLNPSPELQERIRFEEKKRATLFQRAERLGLVDSRIVHNFYDRALRHVPSTATPEQKALAITNFMRNERSSSHFYIYDMERVVPLAAMDTVVKGMPPTTLAGFSSKKAPNLEAGLSKTRNLKLAAKGLVGGGILTGGIALLFDYATSVNLSDHTNLSEVDSYQGLQEATK